MAARDGANLTVVGTGHRVIVTLRGVVSSNIVGRLELTVGALPGTLGTGGGVLVQVPQFPRPLTLTLLVGTVNLQLANFSCKEFVDMSSQIVFFAHWARLLVSDESVSSLLGDVVATACCLVGLSE